MKPSTILGETPGNFAIENNAISEIKIKRKEIIRNQTRTDYQFEMEIHSPQGNQEWSMDERDDYINLLKQVYGERVKTPFGYFSARGVNINL